VPFAVFLGCAIFYSAPPIRAKARPIVDAMFSAGHYVATAWFAYVIAGGAGTPWVVLLAGVLWAMAMHAYSAVPDIAADTESAVPTIATLLGGPLTIALCAVLYTAAAILATPSLGLLITMTLLLPYLVLMRQSMRVVRDDAALMRYYRFFPYVNALVGGVIWWVIVLF
jgi:4-hydroxybenzoate polyprenyltransferase